MRRRSVGEWYLDRFEALEAAGDVHGRALPLSPAQRRFAGTQMIHGRRETLALACRVDDADPARLAARALALTEAQPALRSRLHRSSTVPYQVVADAPHVDCHDRAGREGGGDVVADLLRSVESPGGPVWGFRLVRRGGARLVVLAFDHLVVDEASLEEILGSLFDGGPAGERPAVSVEEYRAALLQSLADERDGTTEAALEHWLGRLARADRDGRTPGPPAAGVPGAPGGSACTHRSLRLPDDRLLWRSLVPVAAACFERALYEELDATAEPPLVGIGLGRSSAVAAHVVGAFFNMLPYLPPPGFEPRRGGGQVELVLEQWLDDIAHGAVALDTIVGAYAGGDRRRGRVGVGAYVTITRTLAAARPERHAPAGGEDVWLEEFGLRARFGGVVHAQERTREVRLRVVHANDGGERTLGEGLANRWAAHLAALAGCGEA
jgi:hypothetical protein